MMTHDCPTTTRVEGGVITHDAMRQNIMTHDCGGKGGGHYAGLKTDLDESSVEER